MMVEFVLGVLLCAAALWFVLVPILRPRLEPAGAVEGEGDQGDDPDEDMSPRAVALRALREIEFDRATGKLSDADYDSLHAKYQAEALAAIRAGEGATTAPTRPTSHVPRPTCPTHGVRPEQDAVFCSDCGRRLGTALGYCARCGSALEREARYCHACGNRVAA